MSKTVIIGKERVRLFASDGKAISGSCENPIAPNVLPLHAQILLALLFLGFGMLALDQLVLLTEQLVG